MKDPEIFIVDLLENEDPIKRFNEYDFADFDNETTGRVANVLGFPEDHDGLTRDLDGIWRQK